MAEKVLHILSVLIGLAVIVLAVSGCTVTKLPPPVVPPLPREVTTATEPANMVVQPVVPAVTSVEVAVTTTPQDPAIVKAIQQYERTKKFSDIQTAAVVKYVFEPTRIYSLSCPEWGVLTVRLLPGETLKRVSAGNPVEWMIEETTMEGDLPSAVLTIKRAPYAPSIQMTAITDNNIYEFILTPGGPLGQKRTRQIQFYDPQAELQRHRDQEAYARAEAQRREQRRLSRYPQLAFDTLRTYQVGGDPVSWRPLRVVGDHRSTIIELPPANGTEQPTLTVIEDGHEATPNARTIPGQNGNGALIIADQPLHEARLIGQGGVVTISGR